MRRAMVLLLILMSSICRAGNLDRFCFLMGDEKEPVCYVSINTLVSRGEEFDGRIVIVQGYFAYSDASVIFATKDDFLSSNTANGLYVALPGGSSLLKKLYDLNHSTVMLKARFSAKSVDLMSNQGYWASGRLYDLMEVSKSFMPWGYMEHVPPANFIKKGK